MEKMDKWIKIKMDKVEKIVKKDRNRQDTKLTKTFW